MMSKAGILCYVIPSSVKECLVCKIGLRDTDKFILIYPSMGAKVRQ